MRIFLDKVILATFPEHRKKKKRQWKTPKAIWQIRFYDAKSYAHEIRVYFDGSKNKEIIKHHDWIPK